MPFLCSLFDAVPDSSRPGAKVGIGRDLNDSRVGLGLDLSAQAIASSPFASPGNAAVLVALGDDQAERVEYHPTL
jgi:hypothetical protein